MIAVPMLDGKLSPHFGHCPQVAMIKVDLASKTILSNNAIATPPHVPGKLPGWLKEQGAELVIAGGMGQRAVDLFHQAGVRVVVGAPSDSVEKVVEAFLHGKLQGGENACNHGSQDHHHACGGHHE